MPSISLMVVTSNDAEGAVIGSQVARNFADRFGGVSIYEGNGLWLDENGLLIHDKHLLVKSYMSAPMYHESLAWAKDQGQQVRELLQEEAVSIVLSPHEHLILVEGEGDGIGLDEDFESGVSTGIQEGEGARL